MKRKLTRKATKQPYKTIHKYKAFVKEYLSNGMNGSQAVAKVYKGIAKGNSSESYASQLLRNIRVQSILADELAKLEVNINDKWVINEIIGILQAKDTKKGDKIRALDLLSNIIGAKRPETQVNQAFFSNVDTKLQDIIAKRIKE